MLLHKLKPTNNSYVHMENYAELYLLHIEPIIDVALRFLGSILDNQLECFYPSCRQKFL